MADEIATSALTDDDPGIALCTKCLGELSPWSHFCPRCRAPATSYANTGPFEMVLAEGWLMGESVVTKSPRLVTVIGLWMLFLPSVVVALVVIVLTRHSDAPWMALLTNAPPLAVAAFYGYCLYRGTRNYARARRRRRRPARAH